MVTYVNYQMSDVRYLDLTLKLLRGTCICSGWGQWILCMVLHLPIARSTISSDSWVFLYYKLIRLTKRELNPHLFVYHYATSAGQVTSNTTTKHPTIFFIPHVSRCGFISHTNLGHMLQIEVCCDGANQHQSWPCYLLAKMFQSFNRNSTSKSVLDLATSKKTYR